MSSKSPCSKMSHCYPIFFPLFILLFSVVYCTDITYPKKRVNCRDIHCPKKKISLGNDVLLRDGHGRTVISPGKTFELGFFTPDGSLNKTRYLGIWYYPPNPKTVVWVANRDKPLLDSSGFLAIRDGNAKVLDAENKTYWSTDCGGLESKVMFELNDIGNLIFSRGLSGWQSFDNPTDTFLPRMNSAQKIMTLTCWQNRNNPAKGNFTLKVQQPFLSIQNAGSEALDYWETPQALSDFFNERGSPLENNSTSRLVMNLTGQVQLWKSEAEKGWLLVWSGLQDRCSSYNTCGNYGTCNSNNMKLCKCLPGCAPDAQNKWNGGDFSGGCSPNSDSCKRNFSDDIFLKLPMMKVGKWNYDGSNANQDCETQCRENCSCVAYSCGLADCKERGVLTCWIWRSISLTGLQEEYSEGITIFVRTHPSDISLTSKNCMPCGTNIIPYPLSTAATCGDPSYFSFYCNASTGQVAFLTSNGTFNVTAIIPEKNTFLIEIRHASKCDMQTLPSPNNSLPFIVTNCTSLTQQFADVEESFIEVEVAWKPPLEPVCNASEDCHDWPHTSCKATGDAKMRCICGSKFRWDGKNLICLRVPFPLKVVITCVSGALAVVLLCGIFFIRHVWKRRLAENYGSVEFQGDDTGGIDVPFFDWGSIIAATENFANVNKLGTGGFGTVYKGKLPDGKEVAVKRLSSVTKQGVEEFRTEVVLIAKLQHRNLVRLVGYCVKADERILLYEYMPNGSLDSCLFDQTRSAFLDWENRFEIIYGIARGLLYLHQDSRLRIIHRDLKPSNILLDEEMNPKISDFGIARIVGGKETEGSTKRVIGTYGYMSPEYAYEGLFSVKSDVFSFGVVMLETISARRNSKLFQLEHGANLQGHAWKLWNEDRGLDLMDHTLKESCNPSEVLKCIQIGLLCVQEDPTDRPTMSLVVLMLGSENSSLPPPKQPAFISRNETSETASTSSIFESGLHDIITLTTEGR